MKNFSSLQMPRGGMQVHAVAEQERYIDSTGKRLPWQYERADLPELSPKGYGREEKGPFGRSNRRRGTSRSRSKTAEPRREEDRIRAENVAAEDAIFGKLKIEQREKDKADSRSDMAAISAKPEVKEPTEVLIYGFGEDLMWSAVEWYERISSGIILEDYERQPSGKQEPLARSLSRATAQKSLSRASLRRKNTFNGGSHWIKVTFDSAEAADLAMSRSPHIIKGHLVYAEPYRGIGPVKDEAIFASSAGAQITSGNMPVTFSTTQNQSPSNSDTVSSATVDAAQSLSPPPQMRSLIPTSRAISTTSSQQDSQELTHRPARIEGATRAILLPADQALLPKQPQPSWFSWIGGGHEIIASTVPKREDGAFDWDKAGFYWQLFFWLDKILGTDFCGLKVD